MGQRNTPAHKRLTICKVVQTLPPTNLESMNETTSLLTPSVSPHCGISSAGTTLMAIVTALVVKALYKVSI